MSCLIQFVKNNSELLIHLNGSAYAHCCWSSI